MISLPKCYHGDQEYIINIINVIKENKNIYHIIYVYDGEQEYISHQKCYQGEKEYISHHKCYQGGRRIYITS